MFRFRQSLMPILIALLLVTFGLRVQQLGVQSFWNDEGSSYAQATRSFYEIATHAAADIHPPLYYWALRVWRWGAGNTEFGMRYLSVLAGVLTVAFTYGTGRRLHPARAGAGVIVGLVGAWIVALNTFHITYSQELRMYAALGLWGVMSLWALAGFFNRPTYRRGAVLGLVNALGLWTQYAFPLVMLAQLGIALVWLAGLAARHGWPGLWRGLWRYTVANVIGLALFAPILPTALRQVTTWPNTGDASAGVMAGASTLLNWFLVGVTAPEVDSSWIAVALILVLFGLHTHGADHRWRGLAPLVFFLVPTAIFLGAGLYREGNIKFLLPSAIGFALATGQGAAVLFYFADLRMMTGRGDDETLRATDARRLRTTGGKTSRRRLLTRLTMGAALAGLAWTLLQAVPPLYTPAYARNDYREIAAQVAGQPQAAVILNAPGQIDVFSYYAPPGTTVLSIPAAINSTDDDIRADTLAAIADWDRLYLVLWGDAERDPRRIVETTLDTHTHEIDSTWYGDVRLIHYATPPETFAQVQQPALRFGDHIRLQEIGSVV
jgi:mannosyltransferase